MIHDLLREGSKAGEAGQTWSKTRNEILAAKAQELVTRVELAECYSFLGQELVDDMMHLLGQHPKRTLTSLSSDRDGLLGERVLRQLGLARSKEAVGSGLGIVKELVSQLARSA